nr:MAG TPA: protein of unknown function (DUF4219) [Bacteriophage sp.]
MYLKHVLHYMLNHTNYLIWKSQISSQLNI